MSRAYAASIGLAVAIFLFAGIVRELALRQPMERIDEASLLDDTYIALEVAKNIGTGRGPRFGAHYTNGVQPLYVLLAAPIYAWKGRAASSDVSTLDEAVRVVLRILMLADLAALGMLALVLRCRFGWGAATLVALAAWAVQPAVVALPLHGLETSLALLAFLIVWYVYERIRAAELTSGRLFTVGASVGLAALARIDLLLAGVVVGVALAPRIGRAQVSRARLIASAALGFALVYGPWLAYSYHYTGLVFPSSSPSVRLQNLCLSPSHQPSTAFYYDLFGRAVETLASSAPELWATCAALAFNAAVSFAIARTRPSLGWHREWLRELGGLGVPFAFGALLFAAYVFYQFGWWFFDRYLYPLRLCALVGGAAGVHVLIRRVPGRTSASVGLAVAALVFAANLSRPALWRVVYAVPNPSAGRFAPAGYRNVPTGYRKVALWAAEQFPKGTVIGAMQSGALAYFAPSLQVVNLDGVVDQGALDALRVNHIAEYARASGVTQFIGWERDLWMLRHHSRRLRLTDRRAAAQLRSWNIDWFVARLDG